MIDNWLDYAAISDLTGLNVRSLRAMQGRARQRLKVNASTDSDMPMPDDVIGRTPLWKKETILQWRSKVKSKP